MINWIFKKILLGRNRLYLSVIIGNDLLSFFTEDSKEDSFRHSLNQVSRQGNKNHVKLFILKTLLMFLQVQSRIINFRFLQLHTKNDISKLPSRKKLKSSQDVKNSSERVIENLLMNKIMIQRDKLRQGFMEAFYNMTQVFIAAVSTTRIELNQEELEFYRDEKNKEIGEVRAALDQLHQFTSLPKKERAHANLSSIWKALLILAKIMGYEKEFNTLDQLQLPPTILTASLLIGQDLFVHRCYHSRSIVDKWDGESEKYYILLQGVIEREAARSSIIHLQRQSQSVFAKSDTFSRFKKNQKRRFARTDQQIPICLNSKRSQARNVDAPSAATYRAVTHVQMLEVSTVKWKRYVGEFKRISEDYLFNFIRKKLGLNLNFDVQPKQENTTPLFILEQYQRKTTVELQKNSLYLLFIGELLVTTSHYRIEISRGCLLNSAITHCIQTQNQNEGQCNCWNTITALTKTDVILIKLDVIGLRSHFQMHPQDELALTQLLNSLEATRRAKKDEENVAEEKIMNNKRGLTTFHTSLYPDKRAQDKPSVKILSKIIAQSKRQMKYKKTKTEQAEKNPSKQKIFQCRDIEARVSRTLKAAELKQGQYQRKAQRSQFNIGNHPKHRQELTEHPLVYSLFKDCMAHIENKSQLLRQIVQKTRREKQTSQPQVTVQVPIPVLRPKCPQSLQNSAAILRRKLQDIYLKTEENDLNYTVCSERNNPSPRGTQRGTVGAEWGGGVMKKMQSGQIRRVRARRMI